MKILLIDDVELILKTFKQLLTQLGHDVVTANSAQEGLDRFFKSPSCYRAIITDIKMPGIDGIEFAEILAFKGYLTPIIFTTGHAELPNSFGLAHSGVLYKPFKIGELLKLLDNIEQQHGLS